MKIGRHPSEARMRPPASVPAAGPSAIPVDTMALAIPLRSGGTCRAMIFDVPGKAMLSPTPSITRSTSSDTKPPTKPISNVDTAQTSSPIVINR
jgi:hypothetical protein